MALFSKLFFSQETIFSIDLSIEILGAQDKVDIAFVESNLNFELSTKALSFKISTSTLDSQVSIYF